MFDREWIAAIQMQKVFFYIYIRAAFLDRNWQSSWGGRVHNIRSLIVRRLLSEKKMSHRRLGRMIFQSSFFNMYGGHFSSPGGYNRSERTMDGVDPIEGCCCLPHVFQHLHIGTTVPDNQGGTSPSFPLHLTCAFPHQSLIVTIIISPFFSPPREKYIYVYI